MVAGVAAGFADYFGVDPVLVRILFVATTFLGGLGLAVYVLAWILMPTSEQPADPDSGRWSIEGLRSLPPPALLGVVIGLVGLIVLTNQIGWHGTLVWGVVLILLGVLLYRHSTSTAPAVASTTAVSASTVAVPPALADADFPAPAPSLSPQPAITPPPPAPKPPRERSMLGWFTLGTLFVALGGLALFQAAGILYPTPTHYLALAVGIIGVGLSIGAFYGRARWMIVPGLLLVPFMLAASLVHVPWAGGSGDRSYRPTSQANLLPAYRMVAGRTILDLRDVELAPGTVNVAVSDVAGQIVVSVPRDVDLVVHARSSAGEVRIFGDVEDGFPADVTRTFDEPGAVTRLVLDLQVSFGQVVVQR